MSWHDASLSQTQNEKEEEEEKEREKKKKNKARKEKKRKKTPVMVLWFFVRDSSALLALGSLLVACSQLQGAFAGNTCADILATERENSRAIHCPEDCSDTYLRCVHGDVLALPMANGTKCYNNSVVHTSAGHCVVTEESISSFEVLDSCSNYPTLEYCTASANPSEAPYNGMIMQDGQWYFVDKVWFRYVSTYHDSNEAQWSELEQTWYSGKGWDVYINIYYGHDQEEKRSRSFVISMDYGTTKIYKWSQYDLLGGGDKSHYSCTQTVPSEPETTLIKAIVDHPSMIFGIGRGEFELPRDDSPTDAYTAATSVRPDDLPEGACDLDPSPGCADGATGNITVLVEGHTDSDTELAALMFRNVRTFLAHDDGTEDDNADDEFDDDEDVDDFEFDNEETTPEELAAIRDTLDDYFLTAENATANCKEYFEQEEITEDSADAAVAIVPRAELVSGLGQHADNDQAGDSDVQEPDWPNQWPDEESERPTRRRRALSTEYCARRGEMYASFCCHKDDTKFFLVCHPASGETCAMLEQLKGSSAEYNVTKIHRCMDRENVNTSFAEPLIRPSKSKASLTVQSRELARHLNSLKYDDDDHIKATRAFAQRRALYFDDEDKDKWVPKTEEDFTDEDDSFMPRTKEAYEKWANLTEGYEEHWEKYSPLLLGKGGGQPATAELLAELDEIDSALQWYFNFTTDMEGSMVDMWDVMNKLRDSKVIVSRVSQRLTGLDAILRAVGIIKYVKPIVLPLRNSISKIRSRALPTLKTTIDRVADSVARNSDKARLRKYLLNNEKMRSKLAKTRWITTNVLVNPFEVLKNTSPADSAAEKLLPVVKPVNTFLNAPINQYENFMDIVDSYKQNIAGVLSVINELRNALRAVDGVIAPIGRAVDPFNRALNTRVTIAVPGPFCTKTISTRIPYPCGVKICKRCRKIFRRRICAKFPCGVKICHKTVRVPVPYFCVKRFSFTIGQVLKGISGLMDIIFRPLNLLVDSILAAIDPPPLIRIPELPDSAPELFKFVDVFRGIFDINEFPTKLLDFAVPLPEVAGLECEMSVNDALDLKVAMQEKAQLTPDIAVNIWDRCNLPGKPYVQKFSEILCGPQGCESDKPQDEHEEEEEEEEEEHV